MREEQWDQRLGGDPVSEEVTRLWRARGLDADDDLPEVVAASWHRCLSDHHLLPDSVPRAAVLTQSEMRDLSATYEDLLVVAAPEVEKLFQRLVDSEYLVSLASPQGVMMLFRCDYQFLADMSNFGVLPGSVWTEERQGTNGVGTCLRVGKPVTIVGHHHYGVATQALTCLTAPVLGKAGALESVLNVTTPRDGDERTNRVVQDIVLRTARRIENRYFGRRYRDSAILRFSEDQEGADIAEEGRLAINDEGIVVAGTSYLSTVTGKRIEDMIGKPAEMLFDFDVRLADIRPEKQFQVMVGGRQIHAALADPSPKVDARGSHIAKVGMLEKSSPQLPVLKAVPAAPPEMRVDPPLAMALLRAEKLLHAGIPLIIKGESGTGKTAFAQVLCRNALGADGVIAMIDCAVPSGPALAAAVAQAASSFKFGAIILDRVDQLDAACQLALLPAIENSLPIPESLFGLISVTSVDLDALVKEGKFRTDLLHRIKGATVELAPLRNMPDLAGAISDILALESAALQKPGLRLEDEARLVLANYHWPGNMRELRRSLRHAAALAEERVIGLQHLPSEIVSEIARGDLTARSQAEASRIEAALRFNGGNVTLTARHLGVSRATLYRKIQIQKMRREG